MISLLYRSFGAVPNENLSGLRYAMVWVLALGFIAASLAILAFLNVFSVFLGVTINFLGRDGVKFTFIQLFGRVPLIGITFPLMLGYALWYNSEAKGLAVSVLPALWTALLAIALLAGAILLNNIFGIRRR